MSGMMRSASCWISSFSASLRFFIRASSSWSQLPAEPQQLDFPVEAAMLGLQDRQHFARIVVIHPFVLQEARIAVTPPAVIGRPRRGASRAVRNRSDKRRIS